MKTKKTIEQPMLLVIITGTTTYQGYINQFISDNYQELSEVAEKNTANTHYNPEELLSELVIYLQGNEKKIRSLVVTKGKNDGLTDKGLLRFCAQWMFNVIRLYKPNSGLSNFTSKYALSKDILIGSNIDVEDDSLEQVRILKQKEQQEDLFKQVVQSLTVIEKNLFNIYFIQGLSVPQIKETIPQLGKFPLYQMVKDLKKKIRTEFEKRIKENANQ